MRQNGLAKSLSLNSNFEFNTYYLKKKSMKNRNILTRKKTLLATSLATAFLGLSACGGGGGDSKGGGDNGSPNNPRLPTTNVQMSGAVVDDFVAFAKVYLDLNNNAQHDENEAFASTDKDGYFSIAKGGTDYCANPQAIEYEYCLITDSTVANRAIIRVESGSDLLTSQAYEASMSLLLGSQTSNLRITSVSTLNHEITNLTSADFTGLGMTKDEFQQKFNAFLADFLNGSTAVNPNTLDPFEPNVTNKARAFKMSVQFHKLAESIAQSFANTNPGTNLKDFLPATYRALLLNVNFNRGLSTDPLTTFNADLIAKPVFEKIAKLTGKKAPETTRSIEELNSHLNCILRAGNDSYAQMAGDNTTCATLEEEENTLEVKKRVLFAAEIATGLALDTDTTNVTNGYKNAVAIRNSNQFKYQNKDFIATKQAATSQHFDPAALDKTADLPETFGGKDISLYGRNAYRIFFKTDGTVTACHRETSQYSLLSGTYYKDEERPFLAYLHFDSAYSFANLNPANSKCLQQQGLKSCITLSYQITGATNLTENIYVDHGRTTDELLVNTTTEIPTSVAECKTAL